MYTVDILVIYFILLYIFFNFKNQCGVFWKSFEEYLNNFHLGYLSLNLVR